MTKSQEELLPILSLADQRAGIAMLDRVFGFESTGMRGGFGTIMALGNQRILIVPKLAVVGSVRPHHLALSIPDTDQAMKECLDRGGVLAQSMTPDGPLEIPEFWTNGVRYVFFDGPEGALIELCMKKGQLSAEEWGHDHIGIECEDIAASQSQFEHAGCNLIASHSLDRDDGITDVAFLNRGASVAELFCPPKASKAAETPPLSGWVGCLNL
jgi:catechol 2,3-dioxygenase-like lactoylglutathione lyase family enzyme